VQSHYLYAHTDAELRRKGRMRPKQRLRRAEIEKEFGRPNPKAIEIEVAELVRLAVRRSGPVEIRSDEHPAYPRAFRRVTENQIAHAVTSSKKARTHQNPLFPVNLMDLLIRHCGANHKRETIAWSKRRWSSALRLAVLQVWRNYLKGTSEKQRDSPTPAQLLGLTTRRLEVADVLACRLFPTRVSLPARLLRYYRGEVPTRRFTNNRTHRLSYAD
jgi:hypothetical protein